MLPLLPIYYGRVADGASLNAIGMPSQVFSLPRAQIQPRRCTLALPSEP